ncbi:allatostatin-A [Rhagoletis pomonella]|uniref:allatostatin-A n=1 Tax=Rhagoletis pomonella TaxID=28610 RepID=UPI00177AC312|nr:allatostatin-A [Rhagoletis pomonella]XP_036325242.1 allatostatin-A [Rhagoletis pomonella]
MPSHHPSIGRSLYTPVLLLATSAAFLALTAYAEGKPNGVDIPQQQQSNTLLSEMDSEDARDNYIGSDTPNYDKRMERYAFGLGRRAYTYTNGGNGMKRLPVYNFGLGKRARPYSFGLGKRGEYDEDQYMDDLINDNVYDAAFVGEKRNRPYSFGLGKRSLQDPPPHRYGFGLGRR